MGGGPGGEGVSKPTKNCVTSFMDYPLVVLEFILHNFSNFLVVCDIISKKIYFCLLMGL